MPYRRFALLLLLAVIATSAACNDSEDLSTPVGSSSITVGSLQLTLRTDRTAYDVSQAVTITVELRNVGAAPLDVDTDFVDFEILTADGNRIFSRSLDGTPPVPPTFSGELAVDASASELFAWDQRSATGVVVGEGIYLIRGIYEPAGGARITRLLQIELI